MECPHCGKELVYDTYYFRGNNTNEVLGHIFKCPNVEGFEEQEDAIAFVKENNLKIGDGPDCDFEDAESICCTSACFNGFFYTDSNDNLNEGYPC